MKNLLLKEFKLSLHPTTFIYTLFGVMLFIPTWPSSIFLIYVLAAFIPLFAIGKENKDMYYTACLPVRKRDIVKAKISMCAIIETVALVIAIPGAILPALLYPEIKQVIGIAPYFAFFGFSFIMFGIFNLIFLPWFYKNAYKVLWPLVTGITVALVFMIICEALGQIPATNPYLNTVNSSTLPVQLGILGGGILIFILLTVISYQISYRRFEKVDI